MGLHTTSRSTLTSSRRRGRTLSWHWLALARKAFVKWWMKPPRKPLVCAITTHDHLPILMCTQHAHMQEGLHVEKSSGPLLLSQLLPFHIGVGPQLCPARVLGVPSGRPPYEVSLVTSSPVHHCLSSRNIVSMMKHNPVTFEIDHPSTVLRRIRSYISCLRSLELYG